MRLAHWHRMTGMLFAFLRDNVSADLLPADHMEHIRGHYRHTAVRTLHIRSEFVKAVRALQAENIEVMALKGVALIDSVYRDPGVREMSDVDLLVKAEFADRAQEIARSLGYEAGGSVSPEHKHLPRLHNHDRELSFEIHTHIVGSDSPLHFDIDTFWQHARPVTLHGMDVFVPSPEHMLLHVSLHFFQDRRFTSGSSLKQLNDVIGLIGVDDKNIDWEFFLSEVKQYRLDGPIFSILSTASTIMGANVPAPVLDVLRPADYSEKMEELFIRQRVLEPNALTATELVPHQSVYTFRAVLKGVFRRMAPNRQYMEKHYGDEAIDAPGRTRLKRLGEVMQRSFGYLRNPLRLWHEVQVDRWLHSLSSGVAVPGNDKHRPG